MSLSTAVRAAGAALVLCFLVCPEAGAQSGDGVSRGAELERIRSEIARLEARLGAVATRRGDQRVRLERLKIEVRLQEERVAEARAERALVEERLDTLTTSISELETRLDATREKLGRGLATLYRVGGGGLWRWLLTASGGAESLSARRTLRYLSWLQSTRVEAFRRDRGELEGRRGEWLVEQGRAEELLASESTRLARLEALRRQQALVVAALEREEAELARRAAELAARQERMTELVSYLASRDRDSPGEVPIQRFKGVLDWPLAGEMTERFGPRRDPRYRTEVPNNGITLKAPEGEEVRAIFPGTVVFAEDFEGFGITVVVHHPGRVFTLYSGLSTARVVQEDVISSGQVLGRASERLYFEVRVEDRPEDPLQWLR